MTTDVGSASRPLRGSGRACLDRCELVDRLKYPVTRNGEKLLSLPAAGGPRELAGSLPTSAPV